MTSKQTQLAAHTILPEPQLLFGGDNRDTHPLRGLCDYGPYGTELGYPTQVRLAYFAITEFMPKLDSIVSELGGRAIPKEALNYYPEYPGFQLVFRVPLVAPADDLKCSASKASTDCAQCGDGEGLIESILQSMGKLLKRRNSWDVVLIHLPISWQRCFEYDGFNLHDRLKARIAPLNSTIQIVNDGAFERGCRANALWGMSVALYAKAGGIPWKLADTDKDEAYVGLSYAIRRRDDGNEYSTCCSQIFDPDGTGFEFIAYDTREFTTDRKGNPYLSYQEMQSVLSRSLLLFQNSHNGRMPRKIFVHKRTHFTEEEQQGAFDAFGSKTEVELVQVIRGTSWYGLKLGLKRERKPLPADYPVDRGSYLPISGNECLLWTQGSVNGVHLRNPKQPVFKEAPLKSLPSPIMVRRFSGDGGWYDTCSSLLSLTKVDWNNNTLYKTLPVTLVYSQVFARVIKQTPEMANDVYDYRFFM